MKHSFFTACAILFMAFIATAAPAQADDGNNNGPDQSIARKMGYRTMANGAVIYEEVAPGESGDSSLENIAPAAGGDDDGMAPVFHYDPVTQTYRRVTVDKAGNTSQDVINTNK